MLLGSRKEDVAESKEGRLLKGLLFCFKFETPEPQSEPEAEAEAELEPESVCDVFKPDR
jgi:hypothetical protein